MAEPVHQWSELEQLQCAVVAWAEEKWPGADLLVKCRKLTEEVGELAEAVARFCSDQNADQVSRHFNHARDEASDCFIALLHIFEMLGLGGDSIVAHSREVFLRRRDRKDPRDA